MFPLFLIFALMSPLCRTRGFNIYDSDHPRKKTSRLFDRLRHYEIISIEHNQLHHVDDGDIAVYPMNSRLEFHAFGRDYRLLIRQNMELFSDTFHVEHHHYDHESKKTHKVHTFDVPRCHYTAEVVSDTSSSSPTMAHLSICRGHGIQGWITAYGETIVIRPQRLLTNVRWTDGHRVNDPHIVYRYHDVDRSDYPTSCGHQHHQQHVLNYFQGQGTHNLSQTPSLDDDEGISQLQLTPIDDIDMSATSTSHRRLQSTTIRYVELAVALDPGLIAQYNNHTETLTMKAIQSISTVQQLYLNGDFGSNVGHIRIVLGVIGFVYSFGEFVQPNLACSGSNVEQSPSLYKTRQTPPYCEVNYLSYLNNWHDYRATHFGIETYDNGQLLSYYDFESTVIGYASIGGMCQETKSGAINQVTYDDEYNGNIITHEMGHNFDMNHDGQSNWCDASAFIMASKGSTGHRPNEFSACSKQDVESFFEYNSGQLACLADKPIVSVFAQCRNGFVEEGESCDCGQEDCTLVGDKCCDGSVCALYAFADCSNDDECCSDCRVADAGSVCRERNVENSCDAVAEMCDGVSAQCPPDTALVEGEECASLLEGVRGYCYRGLCKSIDEQCLGSDQTFGENCYSPDNWRVSSSQCSQELLCAGFTVSIHNNSATCAALPEWPENGIPCTLLSHTNTIPTATDTAAAAQCVNGECHASHAILTYKWTAYSWNACSIDCKLVDYYNPGVQNRTVQCTMQNGTAVDDSFCEGALRPNGTRICNDYVCNFCAVADICGEYGRCDSVRARCDCDSGYGGEFCTIPPSLVFVGIVSQSYKDVTTNTSAPVNVIERADPCRVLLSEYDTATETRTQPMTGVDSLSTLYIGASIGVRWSSNGSIYNLAVGMIRADANGALFTADEWPFYVGTSLASSKCDDECYEEMSCDDFTFTLPTHLNAGFYKLLVRFNNEFSVESDVVRVECSENNCNSVGHGQCHTNGNGTCLCDDGWYGDSCQYSLCRDWSFTKCDDGTECVSNNKPKCFSSTCDAHALVTDEDSNAALVSTTTASTSQCLLSPTYACSDPHFEGRYCELPRDYCVELGSMSECVTDALCEWNVDAELCVYRDCHQFSDQASCETMMNSNTTRSNFLWYEQTWPIFCAWQETLQLCNRITCADQQLPECENGAVRRPLFDVYDATPQSICNAWYCDCSTVYDVERTHWTVTSKTRLLAAIDSSYDVLQNNAPLTADYIDDDSLDLFVCAHCKLECMNGAVHDESSSSSSTCVDCSDGCPIEHAPYRAGLECNQVFWIASFRLLIDYNAEIRERYDEFVALLLQDIAYFLDTNIDSISIWQIKPEGAKSIVFFRYLFDTDDENVAQSIGGDVMLLARDEVSDDTSTAARGFVMSKIDDSYEFGFCIPAYEECDPDSQIDFNLILLICFLASFGCLTIGFIVYRVLTRKRREREYEEQIAEQKRVLQELENEEHNWTRIGMRDVSRKRAKKVAEDKQDFADMQRDKQQKTAILSEAFSMNEQEDWVQHIAVADEELVFEHEKDAHNDSGLEEALEMQQTNDPNTQQQQNKQAEYEEYEYGD